MPKSLKRLNVSNLEYKNRAEEFSRKISSELNNADSMGKCSVEKSGRPLERLFMAVHWNSWDLPVEVIRTGLLTMT